MSASVDPSDRGPEDLPAATELAEQLRQLWLRMDSLDVSGEERHLELEAKLTTALRALELIYDDDPGARRTLHELRASVSYDAAFTVPRPLVSVVIPTWNRVDTLIERAIPSALNQTHSNIEVIVVGDASPPETEQALSGLGDPRVVFRNLTLRGPYEEDPYRSWLASGTPGLNAGVAMASGLWIAPLGDDDEFESHHVERLLGEARARHLEFVYSRGRVLLPEGRETVLGEFPPRLTQIGLQSALYHAGLSFMELEPAHALFDKPNDWGLVHRMMRVGVRMGMIGDITVVYRPSLRAQTPREGESAPRPIVGRDRTLVGAGSRVPQLATRVSELERILDDERARTSDLSRRLEDVRRSRSWRLTAPLRRLGAHARKA